MMESFETFVGQMITEERWPFWAVALVFTIIGQFTSTKLFTRQRAYAPRDKAWQRWLWFWGRETLMLHPIAAGLFLGYFVWLDPEGRGWPRVGTAFYFAAAGVVSMGLWAIIRSIAKARGVEVRLPGQSTVPPPPEA
jgi:hypothetical protein